MERTPEPIKLAACVLIQRKDGMILSVSRKNDRKAWGLPAGSVEDGETPIEAAARELREETSVEVSTDDLAEVFSQLANNRYVKTFLCTKKSDFAEAKASEEGLVGWADRATLIAGPFGSYNQCLFDYLDAKEELTGQSRDA